MDEIIHLEYSSYFRWRLPVAVYVCVCLIQLRLPRPRVAVTAPAAVCGLLIKSGVGIGISWHHDRTVAGTGRPLAIYGGDNFNATPVGDAGMKLAVAPGVICKLPEERVAVTTEDG
ncbi:hypothetical protein LSAT2_010790 [Lamellibrachia satsuma]|nr:hypothetical protein LSAT2_010790 [Lamellibrachia satsuma]